VAGNNNNTATIGFEEKIWAAADILRGNMDAAEYKHVVLGLIFLKYISDKFEERYRELEADNDDVEYCRQTTMEELSGSIAQVNKLAKATAKNASGTL
jgi:type I restriction-modification system DNA methylase subunit